MSHKIYESDYLEFYHRDKCIGDLGEKWCNFKWNIYDLQLNPVETIESRVFTTRLLPNSYWYLHVRLASPGGLTALKISLRRLKSDEKVRLIVDVIFKVTFSEQVVIYDKKKFAYDNETPQNGPFCYLASCDKPKMGYVKIECKLRPNKIMIQKVHHGKLDATLPVDLRKLLLSGELYDTIIKVGSEQLEAHYAIICARMPQLIPPEDRKEEEKYMIEINDLPLFVVKEMLKYIYTGQACLDFESVSKYKDTLLRYGNFFYTCCWEDHPFAETSFNYETDSLEWDLKRFDKKEERYTKYIKLLKMYQNSLGLSLDALEWKAENHLLLSFKFGEILSKPILVSCKFSLVNAESKERIKSGETEILLYTAEMEAKMKLCSLPEVPNGMAILRGEGLILKTDFKICYGGNKSSIKNMYEGQFDISQCTSCALLSADMKRLCDSGGHRDIMLENSKGSGISAHKAILLARWKEAEKHKVKESRRIVMEDYDYRDLCKFLQRIYVGNASE